MFHFIVALHVQPTKNARFGRIGSFPATTESWSNPALFCPQWVSESNCLISSQPYPKVKAIRFTFVWPSEPSSGPPNIRLAFWTFVWSSEDSISFSVRNSKTSFAAFLNSITFLISTQFHFQRSSKVNSWLRIKTMLARAPIILQTSSNWAVRTF